jgi:hypothetical protein
MHYNKPVDWNGAAWDRPMEFCHSDSKKYMDNYEATFGRPCGECDKGRAFPDGPAWVCDRCGWRSAS